MNIFVFDIETIPDVALGRLEHGISDLSDADVAQAMQTLQRQKNGRDFLPLHQHRIIAISVVLRSGTTFKVWSLGEETSSEQELIQRFYHGIDKYTPTLISWNGGGFDLPVIHYRSLLHGIKAKRYWESGDIDQSFRYNNYLNRYHSRHLDLMDVLASYQARASARLEDIATLCGFPGKMGMEGSQVWSAYQQGNLNQIRHYCETDVLNTYLIYLRFEQMRGTLTEEAYQQEIILLKERLAQANEAHLNDFLSAFSK